MKPSGVKPLLPEECFRRIEVATQIVEDVLGARVTSFRAPRLWGSTAMVNALEGRGLRFLTVRELAEEHSQRRD